MPCQARRIRQFRVWSPPRQHPCRATALAHRGKLVGVTTIVFLHAHPDDEASQTAGTMAMAVARGDRVVTIFATDGNHGDVPDDLAEGETLVDRRRAEALTAARILGVQRTEFLGFKDSGMSGWAANNDPDSLVQAPVDEAARRVADILDEEDADVLIGYDWHGNYGHPDHVRVHPITYRAAELAKRRPRVLEETMNRDYTQKLFAMAVQMGLIDDDRGGVGDDGNPTGTPEAELSWRVDVSEVLERKRAALAAHASQGDARMFLSLPPEAFALWAQYEHYREDARPAGMVDAWPF